MTQAIIICCNKQDKVLLPALIPNIKSVYPLASIFVAPCSKNPPETNLPLTNQLRWNTPYISHDILRAMYETNADVVAKIDADTWHVKPYLFKEGWKITGIQWAQNPHNLLGIGYSATREAIITMMAAEPCAMCNRTKEDQVFTWMARKHMPNDIYMYPVGTARKASTYNNQEDACIIHLGCDPDPESRLEYQDMFSAN